MARTEGKTRILLAFLLLASTAPVAPAAEPAGAPVPAGAALRSPAAQAPRPPSKTAKECTRIFTGADYSDTDWRGDSCSGVGEGCYRCVVSQGGLTIVCYERADYPFDSHCPDEAPDLPDDGDTQTPGESPILIDLENDGIRLTGLGDPVWFDIDADGELDLMSWTNRSEGILALDRNGNGRIDNGGELFGNATLLADGTRAMNGYLALAELDSWPFGGNGNELIDAADAAFGSLRMWTDLNHDGISQPAELRTLEEAGILRIGVKYRRSHRTDRHGNEFRFLGRAWKIGPLGIVRQALTWDVFFVVAP